MERNFTNENFEQYLKQNAEGLRMLPSEKVWKGISKHFQKQRRKAGIFIGIGLLAITSAGYYIVQSPFEGSSSAFVLPGNPAMNASKTNAKTDNEPIANANAAGNASVLKNLPSSPDLTKPVLNSTEFKALIQALYNDRFSLTTDKNQIEIASAGLKQPGENNFNSTIVDDTYPVNTESQDKKITSSPQATTDPMSIESVLNSFKPGRKNRVDMQIYFTPTVSYRKLSENKAYLKTVSPSNIPPTQMDLYDINNFVTHKPDFGFELGLTAKYPVTKNLKVKAGLQFNVNRYDIKVFNSSTQLATIRLNNRNGMDSVNRVTNYSNTNGYKSNWLENFYFQVSAPVGVEFKVRGDDKMEFGIASTIQPTYVLGDRAYLISSDYKNYAEVPWLIRRWNVNTSLETFVTYSTGQLKWQVGPQVRYQLLSSFVKKYPVKENLFDFGLKVGIGLNKQ